LQPSLNAFIAAYASQHDFNGTILVEANGKVTYEGSFGFANLQFRVPDTNQTKYKIASVTKAFTSVLILQAVEEGRIDLDRSIGTYIPSYAGPARDKVTIHELLNHTSGIQNFDQVESAEEAIRSGIPNYQAPYTTDQLLAKFCSGPLVHEPGTVFDYNNGDYIILGKILERVYDRTYEQLLKEKLLDPIGLTNTGMLRQSMIIEGLADTYFFRADLGRLVDDLPVYPENWYAAGAMYSTARDVAAFADALFGGRLLRPETLARMITPGLDGYGYGVWSYETQVDGKAYRVVKRPGQIMGAQAELYHFTDPDVTVVILSNVGTTDLDEFVAEIGKRVIAIGDAIAGGTGRPYRASDRSNLR
jgi:CubicO group peptidase (beta-lactamase class C family)